MRNLKEISEYKIDDSAPINYIISGKDNNIAIYVMINIKKRFIIT